MLFTLFTLRSEHKQRIRVHTLFTYVILSKMALYGAAEVKQFCIKSLLLFSLCTLYVFS